MTQISPIIFWFRQDLRLQDHPFFCQSHDRPIVALFILETDNQTRGHGSASRWWLHHSLQTLDQTLGGRLILRAGPALDVLQQVIEETGAQEVHWSRLYDPRSIERDKKIMATLKKQGQTVCSHNSTLLFEPWTIKTLKGEHFKVFTPFWKNCLKQPITPPNNAIGKNSFYALSSEILTHWKLTPNKPNWAKDWGDRWQPGEAGAKKRCENFIQNHLKGYAENRDFPALNAATSQLSAALHWGEASVQTIWFDIVEALEKGICSHLDAERFQAELGWREFSHHLLYHVPHLVDQPMDTRFHAMQWEKNPSDFKQWSRGMTGYPIVDAGMRQLWQTGWMHNRVRMIVASFLVKDLLLPWQEGEQWFWDTLVDADAANNAASWQWVAGCGADASPWFRIFNPVLQGEKFDPEGDYVRAFVPELTKLPQKWIHKPWLAPPEVLQHSGIVLGRDYPAPMISHDFARKRALSALSDATHATET